VARGSFVHPLHNWFVSIAHTDADIDETLDHAGRALRALREAGRRDP
jgi:glutamate-1-semialdehyde 2,1-aminomutase